VQDGSSKQQTKQKYKPNHQQKGLPPHSALPSRGGLKKKTNMLRGKEIKKRKKE